jgi:hypothetical protein
MNAIIDNHSGKCDGCGRPIDPSSAKNYDWRLYCSTNCWQQNKGKYEVPADTCETISSK